MTLEPQHQQHQPLRADLQRLLDDEQGAVFVEYLTLTVVVMLSGAASIFLLGVPLVRLYEWGVTWVSMPIP